VGLTFGNFSTMLYSMAGAFTAFVIMYLFKKSKKFSITGVSVAGGVFHNVGQIMVAIIMLATKELVYYLPFLIIIGTVSGVVIGILSAMICRRIKVAFL
jgi:heptaprenyl diphosphate synthase